MYFSPTAQASNINTGSYGVYATPINGLAALVAHSTNCITALTIPILPQSKVLLTSPKATSPKRKALRCAPFIASAN